MKLGPKYNVNYMGGKCPLGYEYVESFERADGTTVNSFCRKIPKVRTGRDPYIRDKNQRVRDQQKKRDMALKLMFEDANPGEEQL